MPRWTTPDWIKLILDMHSGTELKDTPEDDAENIKGG